MDLSHAALHAVTPAIERLEERRLLSTASFLSPVNTAFPAGAVNTVDGNLNGTGIPSIVAAFANGSAQVFVGASDGTLTGGQVLNTGGTVEALGHFTTSGNFDLATATGVFEGNGNGTFAATPIAGFSLPANTVALYGVDVNGDGNTDLVAGIYTPASGNTAASVSMAVMLSTGSGTFGTPIVTAVGSAAGISASYASDFVFGNFTGSTGSTGHLDVVTPFGLMIGTGTGAFGTATPLPGTTSALPAGPVLAEGNFTNNGNLDLAIEPPGATAGTGNGNIELLTNNGPGVFTIGQTINLATAGGISSLTAADVNEDGATDLVAGIGASSGTPSVAVMLNNGVGAFQAPAFFDTTGVPIDLFTGDFNGDGEPDLLAIDASGGVFPGASPTTGALAGVLINTSTVPLSATVTVTSTANPTVLGIPVQFTAAVAGPTSATAPTGTVTFYDNGTSFGTGTVSSAIATFVTSTLTAGQHAIVASYSGDANYNAANSASLTERVLQTSNKTPLVVPAIASLTAPATAIVGDKATAAFTINNEGGAAANGTVSAAFYVSSDGTIDSSAVGVLTKNFSVHLGIGGAATSNVTFKLPALPAGTYSVLVQLTAVSKLTSDQIATTVAASPTTFQSLGFAFGSIGVHKNIKTTVADALGNTATLSLAGPGTGVVTTANNTTTITVTGTTAASAITIVSRTGSFTFNTIIVSGPLKSLSAKSVTDAGTLTIGSGETVSIALATGSAGAIDSAAPIKSLSVGNWTGGQIIAPSIGAFTVAGSISGDVFTHGGIGSTKIGSITGGTWAIAGNIGTLKLLGSISSAEILAGADSGADNTLDTSDDIYSAATIGAISIAGADTSSTIGAGAVPSNGTFQFLPTSAIHSVIVKGAVSTDARFLSFNFPPTAVLAGAPVQTATDPHFES